MTMENDQKQVDIMKYLILAVKVLLIANLVLIFLPFVEVYMPTKSVTTILGTRYEDWVTHYYPSIMMIMPVISFIIYLRATIRIFGKKKKSPFIAIADNTIEKRTRLISLKIATIVNMYSMALIYGIGSYDAGKYTSYGAYCNITVFGVLNIITIIAFFVILFVFSSKSKKIAVATKEAQKEAEIRERIAQELAAEAKAVAEVPEEVKTDATEEK